MAVLKRTQPEQQWDRLFAPSSCLAVITTVNAAGAVNAATFGTCTRVMHDPVYIAFTTTKGNDTCNNVIATRQFVVNTPSFDRDTLEKAVVCGLPLPSDVDEVQLSGFTPLPAQTVRPPLLEECNRHFECEVEWIQEWAGGRVMVCGRLLAASVNADCVDSNGMLIWEKAQPVHFCGAPYGTKFVAMDRVLEARINYEGPEADAFLAVSKALSAPVK